MLIDHFFGAADVGLYVRGYSVLMQPVSMVTTCLGRLMFPTVASILGLHCSRRRRGDSAPSAIRVTRTAPVGHRLLAGSVVYIGLARAPRQPALADLQAQLDGLWKRLRRR